MSSYIGKSMEDNLTAGSHEVSAWTGASAGLDLGTVLCKHCDKMIDTLDSDKSAVYYSDCGEAECLERRAEKAAGGR
ncbi:SR1 protein [Paenibacillus sp. UNCCL117]|uniref:GapA-binding peptide SR1P n=1 Tax=unclassified Paenibacillus TaxID=185978 RepID=UPI000881C450|nr:MULTISPECIES: GapA-binding peptide SR1P [unclassified Paenibacillus]SDC65044.1 SR1 protein [Paenibacillus sp. cl123]SFW22665.1 SR1 protein [Paenibacillus sp. UNCCL117]